MEKRLSPAPPSYDKRKRLSDPILLLLGIGLASLTAIDVNTLSQGGIPVPKKPPGRAVQPEEKETNRIST